MYMHIVYMHIWAVVALCETQPNWCSIGTS